MPAHATDASGEAFAASPTHSLAHETHSCRGRYCALQRDLMTADHVFFPTLVHLVQAFVDNDIQPRPAGELVAFCHVLASNTSYSSTSFGSSCPRISYAYLQKLCSGSTISAVWVGVRSLRSLPSFPRQGAAGGGKLSEQNQGPPVPSWLGICA